MRITRCGLVIGAIVPTAGASVLSDIKTFQHLGEYAVPLVTGLTIQNLSRGLRSAIPYSAQVLEEQFKNLLTDFPIQVVKLGAFLTRENGEFLYEALRKYQSRYQVVFDPVLQVSVNQAPLIGEDSYDLMRKLCRISTIITPNLSELQILLEEDISSIDDVISNLPKLDKIAPEGLWYIKGGHSRNSEKEIMDIVYYKGSCYYMRGQIRLPYSVHGTGCVLASALSAFLLKSSGDLLHSCQAAFHYIQQQYAFATWIKEDYPFLISHT